MKPHLETTTKDTTEEIYSEYAPEPEKRPYVAVRTGDGKTHAWTKFGTKCGRDIGGWLDSGTPAITCKQCLKVIEAESGKARGWDEK